jgi:hypothetical protein
MARWRRIDPVVTAGFAATKMRAPWAGSTENIFINRV